MDRGFFAQCIYLKSIIFEMLHLGERLKLQMPWGFQDTPFSLLFILANNSPSPANNFQPLRSQHCLTLVRVVRPSIDEDHDRRTTRTSVRQCWLLSG